MGLQLTRTRLDFQSPGSLSAYTEIVTGGLAPYTAASSNVNVITVAQGTANNIISSADSLSGWTLTGCATSTGGPNGAKDIEVTGTGSAQTFDSFSPTYTVTPGAQMKASVYVDSSCTFTYTGEQPRMIVFDVTHGAEVGSGDCYFTSGITTRVIGNTFTVPAGCTSIRVQPHCSGAGLTIPNGQKLKVSQPMLTLSGIDHTVYQSPTSVWTVTPKYRGSAQITYTDSTP